MGVYARDKIPQQDFALKRQGGGLCTRGGGVFAGHYGIHNALSPRPRPRLASPPLFLFFGLCSVYYTKRKSSKNHTNDVRWTLSRWKGEGFVFK